MEASPAGSLSAAALKPYDVRVERDRARRRHLAQATRRVFRVITLVALDAAALSAALWLALLLRTGSAAAWPALAVPSIPVVLLSLLVVNAYGPGSYRKDSGARLRAVLLAAGVLAVQALLGAPALLSPALVIVFIALAAVALELERGLADAGVRALRGRGHLVRPALVVGSEKEALELARQLLDHPDSDLRVVGWVGLAPVKGSQGRLPLVGTVDDLEDVVHREKASVVVLAAGIENGHTAELVTRAFDAGASVLPMLSAGQQAVARLGARPGLDPTTLEMLPPRLELPQLWFKRTLDLLLTLLVLPVALPLLALLALAVRLDSPGAVFFRQTRLGVGGRPFTLWKLRTMVVDAEARFSEVAHLNQYGDGRLFKAAEDPRVTRVGRFLRRTSLDELPQLLNVFTGEMSLVGPRPPLPEEVARYHEDHLVRLTVVPGLTGPWQANGRSEVLDFDEVVRMERDYIRDWSPWLDLRILGRTAVSVARGHGAR